MVSCLRMFGCNVCVCVYYLVQLYELGVGPRHLDRYLHYIFLLRHVGSSSRSLTVKCRRKSSQQQLLRRNTTANIFAFVNTKITLLLLPVKWRTFRGDLMTHKCVCVCKYSHPMKQAKLFEQSLPSTHQIKSMCLSVPFQCFNYV